MELNDSDPQTIGPWRVQSANFREFGRRSYSASTGNLTADILIVELPSASRAGFRANITRARHVASLEIPNVLDASLDRSPQWVAAERVPGVRLSDRLVVDESLDPQGWAELAKTALIGCAALRASDIQAFQLSTNTFIIEDEEIHLADVWAGGYQSNNLYPEEEGLLSSLNSADDKRAIGRLLIAAMGGDPAAGIPDLQQVSHRGFTQDHLDFVTALTSESRFDRPSTEQALRTIPGRKSSWTVPVFALDKPGRVRTRRRAQRALLWVALAAIVVGVGAGLWTFLQGQGDSSDSSTTAAAVAEKTEPEPVLINEVRLTFTKDGRPPRSQVVDSNYDFLWCYPDANLRTDEIPKRLVFQQLNGEDWSTDRSVQVRALSSPECNEDERAIVFTAPVPQTFNAARGWTTCADYRVLIPRLSSEKRAPIRFCLQQRAYEEESS